MENPELLRNATNDEILYAALRILSSNYSLGGVSMGRSLRSCMLEVIINCLFTRSSKYLKGPTDIVELISDLGLFDHLLCEMSKRTIKRDGQLQLFDQIEFLSDAELAEIAAALMLDWYKEDNQRDDSLSEIEYQLVQAIVFMILPPEMPIWEDLASRVIRTNNDRQCAMRFMTDGIKCEE